MRVSIIRLFLLILQAGSCVSNMAVAEKILAPFVPKGKRNSVLLNAVEARKKGCYNSRVVELDRNQVKRWKLNLMALFYERSFIIDP